MNRALYCIATTLACAFPLLASASQPAQVDVYDRSTGKLLPSYWHQGERHVVGEPGHEYEIRIRNRTRGRLLAVTSVDGVNVLSGRTAATDQGGYVIDPRGRVEIEGWRKSLAEVAAFYFTSLGDSYAARTGRPDHVGVIGVALYCEKQRVAPPAAVFSRQESAADTASAGRANAPAGKSSALEERIGTGHGQRVDSHASYTQFERASDKPIAVVRIYYNSERNLLAQGIIPRPRYAQSTPHPFPGGFVPDP